MRQYVLVFAVISILAITAYSKKPSFQIDYEGNQFLLDGEPFRYLSGSIHYFRIPRQYWMDGLKRVRALGFNAIQFFIPWNLHEPMRGEFNFTGDRNFTEFIEMAASLGLWSLVRLGPYACGEIENGGIPWWLIGNVKKLRTSEANFTNEVARYWNQLLPMVKPLLRNNGGPILMVQIENEYGNYDACDREYMIWLRDFVHDKLGDDVVIYTTDWNYTCGYVPDTVPTIDFGPQHNIEKNIAEIRKYFPKGPLVNSEYWAGWIALWGQKTNPIPSAAEYINVLTKIYALGFSINIYMIHGGSNFGFFAGAEEDAPVLQSYDFTAPISEGGGTDTAHYHAIRDWVSMQPDWKHKQTPLPPNLPKRAYGNITLKYAGSFTERRYDKCVGSKLPLTFENIGHPFGYVIYSTAIEKCASNLTIPHFADFAYVYLDNRYQGTLTRRFFNFSCHSLELTGCHPGSQLNIIVENQGRQTYESIIDRKGILSDVLLGGKILTNWRQCGLDIVPRQIVKNSKKSSKGTGFFIGNFVIGKGLLADTFIDTTGWGKGVISVNGFLLGRYWATEGPQMTVYVPATLLHEGSNSVIVAQMSGPAGCLDSKESICRMKSIDHAIFNWQKGIDEEESRKSLIQSRSKRRG